MASFEDLINNPNFGRAYQNSAGFRAVVNKAAQSVPYLAGVFPTLKIDTDANGQIVFSSQNDSRKIERLAGQTNADYLAEAVSKARSDSGVTRYRQYGPTGGTRTGGAANRRLEFLAKQHGIEFDVQSFRMSNAGKAASDQIANITGGNALVVVDSDTSTIVEATRVVGGPAKKQTISEIFNIMGVSPKMTSEDTPFGSPFKRMGAWFNEADLELVHPAHQKRVSVAVYDPKEYFGKDRELVQTMRETAQRVARGSNGAITAQQYLDDAFESLADGALWQSQTSLNRMIAQAENAKDILKDRLKTSGLQRNTKEWYAKIKEIEDAERKIASIRLNAGRGMANNTRIFNAENALTGEDVRYVKGESHVVPDSVYIKLMQRQSPGMSREEILATDFMTLSVNVKGKELPLPKGVRGTDRGQISFATHTVQPRPHTPYSNTLTTATFGSFVNPDNYLTESLTNAIQEHTDAIRRGEITPGLKNLIDEMANPTLDDFSPAEISRANNAKAFAARIKNFIATGGDLTTDPFLTKQLLDQVQAHYFALNKKSNLLTGKKTKYQLGTESVDALNTRFPMAGATLAHLESSAFGGRNGQQGLLSIDHKRGTFGISPHDIMRAKQAWGGFDFDDSIYSMYRYDPKTRRLLALTLRDPNAMGEYFIFDADITHDKNIPKFVRDIYVDHNKALRELENAKRDRLSPAAIESLARRLNARKGELHEYFSGGTLYDQNNKPVTQDFIKKMDVRQMFSNGMPSPAGNQITNASLLDYESDSFYRSFRTIKTNVPGIDEAVLEEGNALRSGNRNLSPFEYRNKFYNEYNDINFTMIRPKELSEEARNAVRAMSQADIYSAIDQSVSQGGTLGRAINQYTIIDQFISTNLDYTGDIGVDARIRSELQRMLKQKQLTRIDRETLIDALVKGGPETEEVVRAAQAGMESNMTTLGRMMRDLQSFADQNNIDYKAGLDPIMIQERLQSDREQFNALARGFGSKDFAIGADDPRSTQARLLRSQLDIRESTIQVAKNVQDGTVARLSEKLGDDFTPEQLQKAQDLINDYEEARSVARKMGIDDAADAVRTGNNTAVEAFGKEGIHLRTLGGMAGWDKKQVLAVAKVLAESGGDMGMLNQAAPLDESGISVNRVFRSALAEDDTLDSINRVHFDTDFDEFIDYSDGTYKYSDKAQYVLDTAERDKRLMSAWNRVNSSRRFGNAGPSPMPVLRPQREFDEIGQFILGQVQTKAPSTVQIPKQLGEMNQLLRSAADVASSELSWKRDYPTMIRRLSMDDVRTSKGIRSGLIAMGAFAALGIGHRLVKGDRTVDEANPYPLIPQDSRYDTMLRNEPPIVTQEMRQGGGMAYVVRANNVGDVSQLSSSMQGVLPNGKTTIYSSNAYNLNQSGSSSRSILQERLGS